MLDPFPIPPPTALVAATKPLADALNLQTLPLHIHEVLFAAAVYTGICNILSPFLSARLFPKVYPRFSRRTKVNWDVHVVSFAQACIISALSLYVIWFDEERRSWRPTAQWRERIWGYHGAGGLCQSFALGYFLWDLVMCSLHTDIFGLGMLAHAVSAVAVFALGYMPFIYFSAPIFLLYELSSPFLNIHWFCDKLGLTGSIYQAVNGAFLTGTFFGCRLVWGISSSVWVFRDMFWAIQDGSSDASRYPTTKLTVNELLFVARDEQAQLLAFNPTQYLPLWLPLVYLASNVVLNTLNVFWFGKMIQTIRTRFDPPWGTRGVGPEHISYQPQTADSSDEIDSDLGVGQPGKSKERKKGRNKKGKKKGSVAAARKRAEDAITNGQPATPGGHAKVQRVEGDGVKGIEVTGSQRKNARSRRKA